MGVEDLKHFQLGASRLSKATLDTLVDLALAYAREPRGLRIRERTVLVKTQASIAAQASGSVKSVVWDGAAWYEEGEAFTAFNIGPGTAESGVVVPLLSGHTDLPAFQYFAAGAGDDESSSSVAQNSSSSTSGQQSSSESSSTEGNPAGVQSETAVMNGNDTDIYNGNTELLSITVNYNGTYLVAGAMSCEPQGAGDVALYILKNDDMAALPGCAAHHAPAGSFTVDHIGIPMTSVLLSAGDEIKLIGYAFGGTPGNGATVDGTSLTVVGPLP